MKIQDIIVYKGRNIYCHRPVMKMVLDIGKYGVIPTKDIKGFNDKLLIAFPGLKSNYCGLGYEGGFLEKLKSGTYLAHVAEHVILEMQYLLGYNVRYGKTRVISEPSIYYLVYEYQNETCGLECGKTAIYILNCFIRGEEVDINYHIDTLKKVSIDSELGPSTAAIAEEARKRGIPVTRIGSGSLVRLAYGKYSRIIQSTLTDATSCISADISSNKQITKMILKENRIPVPKGRVVYSESSAIVAAEEIGLPVAIKPYDGNQGKGVHLNLKTRDEIRAAFNDASIYSNAIIVEQYIEGKDYRVLVVGDKVAAVAERLPPMVVGDGSHNITGLVEIVNRDENRGDCHEKPLTKIKLDKTALGVLAKKGIDINYVPKKGETVILRENKNLSTGGTAADCTDIIHPDNARLAVEAAKSIGLDIAGIDIVTYDISKPLYSTGGAVVEVNTAPGIRMHLYPSRGKPRNVAREIIDMLFPDNSYLNFPIVSVAGTAGRTAVVQIISHILSLAGRNVGAICQDGAFINDKCIIKYQKTEILRPHAILFNKAVDAAVFEMPLKNIILEGLPYDLADIGIITNIRENGLEKNGQSEPGQSNYGQTEYGIDSPEDLAFINSLVAEAVKLNGYAVLNGDDDLTGYILNRIKTRAVIFAQNLKSCQKYGFGKFVYAFTDQGYINIRKGNRNYKVIKPANIPCIRNNPEKFGIDVCLAAVSALYGLNVPIKLIASGLASFTGCNTADSISQLCRSYA